MAKQRLRPDDDSKDAFREAVKDVTPLRESGRVVHASEKPPPLPLQRLEDDRQVLQDSLSGAGAEPELESGDALAFLRSGLSPQVLRRLRAGFWAVQEELDLHGSRTEQARALLTDFFNAAQRRGLRCVRVIHGRGRRSRHGEPVLKRKVAAWLTQRGDVLAFCEARPVDGGAGAVMVLLQARAAKPDARAEEDPG
jgi:DNA-nicking Smr family endonuclease